MNDNPQYHALLCLSNKTRRILKIGYILNLNGSVAIGTDESGIEHTQKPQLRTFLADSLEGNIVAQDKFLIHHERVHAHVGHNKANASMETKMLYWKIGAGVGKQKLLSFTGFPNQSTTAGRLLAVITYMRTGSLTT